MNQEEQDKKMGQLIAKCWADEGFKQKLLADPAATLKAEGVEVPAGLSIKAVENDEDQTIRQYDKVLFDPREAIPVELEHDNRLFVVALDKVLAIFRRSEAGKPPTAKEMPPKDETETDDDV